jgi:diacylglycerol kinase family enzyme
VVGNVGILPGGFSILPGASLEDGTLDVGVLAPQHILGWAVMARRMLAHGHDVDRQFEHHRASTVEITTATELPREMDGDIIAPGRSLSVRVLPKALVVRAPRVRRSIGGPATVS